MNIAYIGLGSNLSNPKKQIIDAIAKIRQLDKTHVTAITSLYFSRPMGPQDQPDYMNAVLALQTELSPLLLLDQLQTIENDAGRVRKDNRWGARILDLDIILYNDERINNARLTVPHYGMQDREFVLLPLAEITNNLILPDGKNVSVLADTIENNGLKIHSQLD